jgi:hypothetical protein
MKQKRNKKSNQDKSKRNGKIMRCSYHTRPVFENDTCTEFIRSVNKEADNNCRNCKHSF